MTEIKVYHSLRFVFKPTLLFFSANVLTYSIHELSHALSAYFLHIESTLFHFYANINRSAATTPDNVIIALVGPICSLCFGIIFWFIYKKGNSITSKLFCLYSAIFGICIFLGNLFSTAFAGDFNTAAGLLGMSSPFKLPLTFTGLILLILFMYKMGKEFLRFNFTGVTTKNSVIVCTILFPWLFGTGLLILAYLPLPGYFITGIISSSFFWIFSLIAAFKNKATRIAITYDLTGIHWGDVALVLASVATIRLLVSGISFTP